MSVAKPAGEKAYQSEMSTPLLVPCMICETLMYVSYGVVLAEPVPLSDVIVEIWCPNCSGYIKPKEARK